MEVMERCTNNYTHGVLIDFDFTQRLNLREQVQRICAQRGWEFEEVAGDIGLLQLNVAAGFTPAMGRSHKGCGYPSNLP